MSDRDVFDRVARGEITSRDGAHIIAERMRRRHSARTGAPVALLLLGVVLIAAVGVARLIAYAATRGAASVDQIAP